MNSKDVEILFRLRSGDDLAQPDFKHLREAVAKETARLAGEIAAVSGKTLTDAIAAANVQLIETIRSARPLVLPPFPGLDAAKLAGIFFEQMKVVKDEK